jgi:hypothetical protein
MPTWQPLHAPGPRMAGTAGDCTSSQGPGVVGESWKESEEAGGVGGNELGISRGGGMIKDCWLCYAATAGPPRKCDVDSCVGASRPEPQGPGPTRGCPKEKNHVRLTVHLQ